MTNSLSRGWPPVLVACAGCFAADLVALEVGPATGRGLAISVSAVATVLIPLFWLMSAFLIDRLARPMGGNPAMHNFLDVSGPTYVVLVAYPMLGVLDTALHRWVPAATSVGDPLVTVLALAAIATFVVLTARLVQRVYRVPALNAVALAFAPYALLTALLIAVVLVVSVLHGVGLI
jgi:hypothetical protein